jgi:hypothetical protein
MPSFAELRAKAEAAATAAKSTANSKLAAYRGDEQPAKPVYKPPPRRPPVRPDVPLATRPRTPDGEVDTDPQETRSPTHDTSALVEIKEGTLGTEIHALVENKALFFEFLDDVCTYPRFRSWWLH